MFTFDADMARYQVKRRGGSDHQVYDARDSLSPVADVVEADLLRALACGELDVAYQPIVQPYDRFVVGVGARLRWTHPSHKAVAPPVVITLAERRSLINEIDDWVLRRPRPADGGTTWAGEAEGVVAQALSARAGPWTILLTCWSLERQIDASTA